MGKQIADEAAIHLFTGCKGASGLKPCCLCWNAVSPTSDHRSCVKLGSVGVYTTEPDFHRFHQFTEDGILNVARALAAAHIDMTNGSMTKFNHKAFGEIYRGSAQVGGLRPRAPANVGN